MTSRELMESPRSDLGPLTPSDGALTEVKTVTDPLFSLLAVSRIPSRREVNGTKEIPVNKVAETMVANGNLEKKAAGASPDQLTAAFGRQLSLASRSIHADDYTNTHPAVAPPMHVSTTFRYSDNPDELLPWADMDVSYLSQNPHGTALG
jgi:hypothetical protein